MVCVAVAVLPQLSTALHCLTIWPQPSTTVLLSCVKLTVMVGSQLSVAVTVAAAGILSHCAVMLAGTPTRVGAVLSWTVIVCVAVAVVPQLSTALHCLTIWPQPSTTVLLTCVKLTVMVGSQLSVAVTVAAAGILSHCAVTLAGTPTRVGAVLSWTVIV